MNLKIRGGSALVAGLALLGQASPVQADPAVISGGRCQRFLAARDGFREADSSPLNTVVVDTVVGFRTQSLRPGAPRRRETITRVHVFIRGTSYLYELPASFPQPAVPSEASTRQVHFGIPMPSPNYHQDRPIEVSLQLDIASAEGAGSEGRVEYRIASGSVREFPADAPATGDFEWRRDMNQRDRLGPELQVLYRDMQARAERVDRQLHAKARSYSASQMVAIATQMRAACGQFMNEVCTGDRQPPACQALRTLLDDWLGLYREVPREGSLPDTPTAD